MLSTTCRCVTLVYIDTSCEVELKSLLQHARARISVSVPCSTYECCYVCNLSLRHNENKIGRWLSNVHVFSLQPQRHSNPELSLKMHSTVPPIGSRVSHARIMYSEPFTSSEISVKRLVPRCRSHWKHFVLRNVGCARNVLKQ